MKIKSKQFIIKLLSVATLIFSCLYFTACSCNKPKEPPVKSMLSIELVQEPKLIYEYGQELDLTNVIIKAKYDDGSSVNLTYQMIKDHLEVTGFEKEIPGNQTVRLHYKLNGDHPFNGMVEFVVEVLKPTADLCFNESFVFNKVYDGNQIEVKATDYEYKGDQEITIKWFKKGESTPLDKAPKDAGEYIITLSCEANERFGATSLSHDFEIKRKDLQIDEVQKTYTSAIVYNGTTDISDHIVYGKLVGLVEDDTNIDGLGSDAVSIDEELSTATLENKNVGPAVEYVVHYVLTGPSKDNYNAPSDYASRTNVSPLQLNANVNLLDEESVKEYDGTNNVDKNLFAVELTNAAIGDEVSLKILSATTLGAAPGKEMEVQIVFESLLEGKDAANYILPTKTDNTVKITITKAQPLITIDESSLELPVGLDFNFEWMPNDSTYQAEFGTRSSVLYAYADNPFYGDPAYPDELEKDWILLSQCTPEVGMQVKLVYEISGNEFYEYVKQELEVEMVENIEMDNSNSGLPRFNQEANTSKWYKVVYNDNLTQENAFYINGNENIEVEVYNDNLSPRVPTIANLYYSNYVVGETFFIKVITNDSPLTDYELLKETEIKANDLDTSNGGTFTVFNNTTSEVVYKIVNIDLPYNGQLIVTSLTEGVKCYKYNYNMGTIKNEVSVGSIFDYNNDVIFNNCFIILEIPKNTEAQISFEDITEVYSKVSFSDVSVIDIDSSNENLNSGLINHEYSSTINTKAVFFIVTSTGGASMRVCDSSNALVSAAKFIVYNKAGTALITSASNCDIDANISNVFLVIEVELYHGLDTGVYTFCLK